MIKDGKFQFSAEDQIMRETMLTRGGDIVNPRVRESSSCRHWRPRHRRGNKNEI